MRPVPYSASDRCIEILKSKRYFGTRVAAVGAIFALAAALLACAAKPVVATDASRKKARYYYSAGIVEQAQGHEDRAYEYFRKAYDADPGYVEAASAYGTRRLSIGIDTLQSDFEISRSLGMMRSYIDKYPEDLYESQYYGFAVGQLDYPAEAVEILERAYTYHPETTGILIQLSDVYARQGDMEKAVESIDRYEKQEGLQPQVTTRKLSYLLADLDTVGAIREVTRLVDSDPTSAPYRILKGNVFDIIEMPDSALIYYQEAEVIDPSQVPPNSHLPGTITSMATRWHMTTRCTRCFLPKTLTLSRRLTSPHSISRPS